MVGMELGIEFLNQAEQPQAVSQEKPPANSWPYRNTLSPSSALPSPHAKNCLDGPLHAVLRKTKAVLSPPYHIISVAIGRCADRCSAN